MGMIDVPLPTFERPPVNEVALAAQFTPLPVGVFDLAQLAEELKAVHPGHSAVYERPAQPPFPARDGGILLEIRDAPEPPLFWLLDDSGQNLIQLQRDRLVVNWRKLAPDQPYPSFGSILPRWKEAWAMLQQALLARQLGELTPNACEVSYFNAIDPPPSEFGHLVNAWSGTNSDAFLPDPSEVRVAVQYPLPDEAGSLSMELLPGIRPDTGAEAVLLRTSARGWPAQPTHDAVLGFFDVAHEWIVRGFASFTAPSMHQRWERSDVSH